MAEKFNPSDLIGVAVQGASDVTQIANTARTVQSPEFQAQVEDVKTAGVAYGGLTLLFQGICAGCLFYIAWKMSED